MSRNQLQWVVSDDRQAQQQKDGTWIRSGGVTGQPVYDMLGVAVKPAPRFWMERLSLSKGLWLRAERPLQGQPLDRMMNAARVLPHVLRVVVLDWKDSAQILGPDATLGSDDAGAWVRPAKGRRKISLTPQGAGEREPIVRFTVEVTAAVAKVRADARQASRDLAVQKLQTASQTARQEALVAHNIAKRAAQPVHPVPSVERDVRDLLAKAHGGSSMALAMRRAVAA